MYINKEKSGVLGPASGIAEATVEGSLLKSRLITNRWLGHLSREKQKAEETKVMMEDVSSMMPYSDFSTSIIPGNKQRGPQPKVKINQVEDNQDYYTA